MVMSNICYFSNRCIYRCNDRSQYHFQWSHQRLRFDELHEQSRKIPICWEHVYWAASDSWHDNKHLNSFKCVFIEWTNNDRDVDL